MDEYYEIILRHRMQDGTDLEQPIIVKGFISGLMQRSIELEVERESLIEQMCHKIKECWMQTRREGGPYE